MSSLKRCRTCRDISKNVWRDMYDRARCRRCQYGFCDPVPDPRQVAMNLFAERVAIVED